MCVYISVRVCVCVCVCVCVYVGFNLLATSEYLDTRNSQWVRGPSLPNPRRGACSVALGGRLLIFGGWDGSQHLRDAHWMVQILENPIFNDLIYI